MPDTQWEYCHVEIGCSDDSSWTCKITFFGPQCVLVKEFPALKRSRADNINPYYKVIGVLGCHCWEAISLSISLPRNHSAAGYFKREILPGRIIDDLQVML